MRHGTPSGARALCVAAAVAALAASPVRAQVKIGELELGGAARLNIWDKSWAGLGGRPLDDAELDTLRVRADDDEGRWVASAEYRYYPYSDGRKDTHFPHHAYVGYRPDEASQVSAGIQQVPFGLTPFASNSYFFTIAYYVGLEDDYDFGVKYERKDGPWSWAAAYYLSDEGDYSGASRDSARYSYDVVKSPDSANSEEGQFNLRLARDVIVGGWGAEVGGSLQYGRIPNAATGEMGEHVAGALHVNASRGRWRVKAESIAYSYDLKDPAGVDRRRVVMGAYDFPYFVAADGEIHSLAVSYALPVDRGPLETVTFYNDYSILTKDAAGYRDTQHNVLGAALDFKGPLFVYIDLAMGKNNAWIGPDFGTALAEGGGDDDWHTRFNVNVGLYF